MEVNDDNVLELLETQSDIEPTYLKNLGIDIRVEDPQKQFSPLEDGLGK
jgi:hypothetical protein